MLTPKECANAWKTVVRCYREGKKENNPRLTTNHIVEKLGMDVTKETFAAIAAIKKHDGRIYGKNREYMDAIPVDPECLVWDHSNPMLAAGLDEIHTTHVDNLITELRRLEKERLSPEVEYGKD